MRTRRRFRERHDLLDLPHQAPAPHQRPVATGPTPVRDRTAARARTPQGPGPMPYQTPPERPVGPSIGTLAALREPADNPTPRAAGRFLGTHLCSSGEIHSMRGMP